MSFKSAAEFLALKGDAAPTTAERKLIEATQKGLPCDLSDSENPSRPVEATDSVLIRALLLRLLIIGGSKDCRLHERGVTLIGGWIEGWLDLAYCSARGQTSLLHCHFVERPSFAQSHFQLLNLQNCRLCQGLFAHGIQVKGSLFLDAVSAARTVDLAGATIGGQIACDGAQFDGGKDEDGSQRKALNLQGAESGKDLFLRHVIATGTVHLSGARILGQFACEGAHFDGGPAAASEHQRALDAQELETGQDIFLNNLTANGTVALNGAKVGGQLNCTGARFSGRVDLDGVHQLAISFVRMRVSDGFIFNEIVQVAGRIDMTAAHVGDLVDDLKSWPLGEDQLILDGFTYDRTDGPTTLVARRDWLRAGSHWQGEFFPQPYTQLAKVVRQMGHASEARLVLIEREGLLAEHRIAADRAAFHNALQGDQTQRGEAGWIWLRMSGFRLWTWLTKTIAGYGYAPQRALYCSLFVVPLFAFAYALFWQMGAMVPADAILLATPEWADAVAANPSAPSHAWAGPAASHYETFYSLPYALDVFLPIVDLGQQSTWSQTTVTWWGWGARVTTWVLQSLGYIITSLGLAAATGIIQRNQPD